MISWLFEINTLRLSTKDVTWGAVNYSGVVISDTFSGITMRWDIAGNGLIAPNELNFDVSNASGIFNTASFDNQFCIVRLIIDDVQTRVWKFKINRTISYYGKITCYCVDFLQEFITGDYPNTKAPKEIWSSTDIDESDDYCVPVILGVAYIPVRSVNTGTERFYVLGESGPTYTVHEVMSPRDWPNSSIWPSSTYSMNGYVNSGYQLLQPIIAASVAGGVADSPGLWINGDSFYDMLCRYQRSDTVSLTNPAEWIKYVIEDFGVASTNIDTTSFTAAGIIYDSETLGFDGGGWWLKESRESVLSNLLAQTDSYIKCTDKVELYQFDKTPVEIITDVLLSSFSPSTLTKSANDSGRVHWPESYTKPSDLLNGQAVVPTHDSGTEVTPSSDILPCSFICGDSINAQKAGILYFQKKYEQIQTINFSVTLGSIVNQSTLAPGHVVTVSNSLYGGTSNVIITEMTINSDMRVDFTGVVLAYLEDWGDLTTTVKNVITDTSLGYKLATTDYNGNLDVDTDWDTLLNIPDRFLDSASLGINVTDSYLGYYDGTSFKSYIQNNGNFQFMGDGNNYINWNGSTLNVVGSITIKNPATVRSTINVADGADVTATSTFVTSTYPSDKTALQTQIDGKIETWFQSTDPSLSWATIAKPKHTNDMWWNTSTKKLKSYTGSAWSADLTDQTAIDAYADAALAQDTADGKRRVFVTTPVTTDAYDIGDLWDRGSALGIWRCKTAKTSGVAYSIAHWSKVADDTQTKIDGGVITTGYIRDSGSNMVINFSSATITINNSNGLTVNGNGSIKITDTAAQNSNLNATWVYKDYFAANTHSMNIVSSYATSQFTISGYMAHGFPGGLHSIGGSVTTDSRLNCSASTLYDTFTYAARFNGPVILSDDLRVGDDMHVQGSISCSDTSLLQGNVGIGQNPTTNKLDVAGVIKASLGLIPSNSSGTITDFEEGVYTAILTPGSGSITLNSTWNKLQYTKIGKMVTVCGSIYIASVASPTGTLLLNLPFSRINSSGLSGNSSGSITYGNVNALPPNNCLCLCGDATATIAITFAMTTGQNGTTAIYMKASTSLLFNFSYTAA